MIIDMKYYWHTYEKNTKNIREENERRYNIVRGENFDIKKKKKNTHTSDFLNFARNRKENTGVYIWILTIEKHSCIDY